MRIVTITHPIDKNRTISMGAYTTDARNGFNHLAETCDGSNIKAKCHYINRTWEVYTYQTILHNLCEAWINECLNLKRTRKKDQAEFDRIYKQMTKEVDDNRNWC